MVVDGGDWRCEYGVSGPPHTQTQTIHSTNANAPEGSGAVHGLAREPQDQVEEEGRQDHGAWIFEGDEPNRSVWGVGLDWMVAHHDDDYG